MAFQGQYQYHQPYAQQQSYDQQAQHAYPTFEDPNAHPQQHVQPHPPPYVSHGTLDPQKAIDVSYQPVQQTHVMTQEQSRFQGFRVSLGGFSLAALVVLGANIGISIYCVQQYGNEPAANFKPVFTGDCKKTKQINTLVHLLINILSSLLLTGSNFSMQVLTAPTRSQVDQAHAQKQWLDIGIPSFRNLKSMGKKRLVLWSLILMTSAPLHLVYNSIFSQSWTRQAYEAALVTQDFVDGAPFLVNYAGSDLQDLFEEIQANASMYERLGVIDCVKAYDKRAITDRKTVLVVTSSPRPISTTYSFFATPNRTTAGRINPIYATEDYVGNGVATETWDWMCNNNDASASDPNCDLSDVIAGKADWSAFGPGVTVDYCLSEYLGEKCTLEFSLGLMITVCVCNLIKLICMVTIFFMSLHSPLLNIGDAISSFLSNPDLTTAGMCLAGKAEIDRFWKKDGYVPPDTSLVWAPRSTRWFKATSRSRWVSFSVLTATTLILATAFLAIGISNPRTSSDYSGQSRPWWKSGFGASNIDQDSKFVITQGKELYQPHRLVPNILLANLPQLVISFLFLAYNAILTSMLMAKEWTEYAHSRRTLRVTSPSGQQRSTYWLSLPYRFAIPLLVSSMLLHWLISQAIFLDRRTVEQVWWNEPYTDNTVGSVSTVGYSPLAVMICLLWGLVMVGGLMGLGLKKYKAGIPLASSCSAAISAACHTPVGEYRMETKALQWGVVGTWNGVGHCSFSSGEVVMPQANFRYAGCGREYERGKT